MGLVKAGIYLGAATYIIKKIKEDKPSKKTQSSQQQPQYLQQPPSQHQYHHQPQHQTSYPPPGTYPQYQDNMNAGARGYPPQYQQVQGQAQQKQEFGYYDTHGPYEAQYQTAGRSEPQTYAPRHEERRVIEDAPKPRQWAGAEKVGSTKW